MPIALLNWLHHFDDLLSAFREGPFSVRGDTRYTHKLVNCSEESARPRVATSWFIRRHAFRNQNRNNGQNLLSIFYVNLKAASGFYGAIVNALVSVFFQQFDPLLPPR